MDSENEGHAHHHSHERIHADNDVIRIKNPLSGKNTWKILAIVFGIALVVSFYFLYSGKSFGGVSGETAGKTIVEFLNGQTGGGVSYISSKDLGNVYEIAVTYDGQQIPVYVTKDGKYFVQSIVPLSGEPLGDGVGNELAEGSIVSASEDNDAVLGSKAARVTIIEFSDYQCPYCEKFWSETLPQIKKEYIDTGKVKFIYRDFPLDIHPDAQKSAEAAECARKSGGDTAYWKMHDKLFANQQSLSVTSLKKYAQEIGGVPIANFERCLDNSDMAGEVGDDLSDGLSYGISGTPAFFINGRTLVGAQPFSAFKKIIDEELQKK